MRQDSRPLSRVILGNADRATFIQEIAPKLANVALVEMMDATGLSRPYCAMIRRGERVPHARHWEPLRALVSYFPSGNAEVVR